MVFLKKFHEKYVIMLNYLYFCTRNIEPNIPQPSANAAPTVVSHPLKLSCNCKGSGSANRRYAKVGRKTIYRSKRCIQMTKMCLAM